MQPSTENRASYASLFISFLKIGLFTIGGGYAMIPLIEREVVTQREWLTQEDFSDLLTIAQSVPGPIALNSAAFVGYKNRGYLGALSALLGIVVPCFTVILIVAIFFGSMRDNKVVEAAFKALRPVVVALIIAPTISLMKGMGYIGIAISLLIILLFTYVEISPAIPLIIAIVGAAIWTYTFKERVKR